MKNLIVSTDELPDWIQIDQDAYLGTLVGRGMDQDHGFGLLPDYALIAKVGE